MTYEQLLSCLQKMPKERLKDTVTVLVLGPGEYMPIGSFVKNETSDVIDVGHMYLRTE